MRLLYADTLNRKIALSVLFSFVISFLILSTFMYVSYTEKEESSITEEIQFYSQSFDSSQKKLFLLGQSHIMPLNSTFIEKYLEKNGYHYTVYNLAIGSNEPKDRVKTIDHLISAKPDLVVYGIAERDFRSSILLRTDETTNPELLPAPNRIFEEFVWNLGLDKLNFLENPKLNTLVSIYETIIAKNDEKANTAIEDETTFSFPNMPFYKIYEDDIPIVSEQSLYDEVIKTRVGTFREIPEPYKNPDAIALKEIIQKMQSNNIQIIIFTTPHHQSYIDITPIDVKKKFDLIQKDLSNEFDITIHTLYDKYANETIWNDPTHIAVNPNSIIFSQDIAKIIISELKENAI